MENNHVVIDLAHYNALRDFQTEVKKTHSARVGYSWDGVETIYSLDDSVKYIAKINEKLLKEIYDLKHPKEKSKTIEDIMKMSWWELYKWKRKFSI